MITSPRTLSSSSSSTRILDRQVELMVPVEENIQAIRILYRVVFMITIKCVRTRKMFPSTRISPVVDAGLYRDGLGQHHLAR